MNRPQYYAYNQTSECFLSLGVILCESTLAQVRGIWGKIGRRVDEGAWITRPKGIRTIDVFSARDLIYLDNTHKVVCVIESLPAFHLAPHCPGAASILALPVRTIRSSQTQPGNQLVICVAEEMEFRLRSRSSRVRDDSSRSPYRSLEGQRERRRAARKELWPRPAAYDATGEPLPFHGIRDISATGLYLMTPERWPLGSHVRMSLQRTDGVADEAEKAITAEMRVARWGDDGVGLEFMRPEPELAEHAVQAVAEAQ